MEQSPIPSAFAPRMRAFASRSPRLFSLLVGLLILAAHYAIFRQYLPNRNGNLGHDFSYILPRLLDGYYWFRQNGAFSIHWFSPAFCGGIPVFPHPTSTYLSVPQFLTFLMDPVSSLQLSFLAFGAVGYFGMHALLRKPFATSRETACLGATLFLFNGFYSHRFLIGHTNFHAFMLVPVIAFLLLREDARRRVSVCMGTLAGVCLAYGFHSGMGHVLPAAFLAVVLVALLHLGSGFSASRAWMLGAKFGVAILVVVCLSAAKLNAALSFLSHFSRAQYAIPGVVGAFDLFAFWLRSMFIGPQHVLAQSVLANTQVFLGRHEFEFGVTFIPAVLLVVAAAEGARRLSGQNLSTRLRQVNRGALLVALAFALLFLVPILLNHYSPAWNALIKRLPILKSSSQMTRWFCAHIPVLVVVSAMAVKHSRLLSKHRLPLACAGVCVVIALNAFSDRQFYQEQSYSPNRILAAYRRCRAGEQAPQIDRVVVCVDPNTGKLAMPLNRNDSVAEGNSQMLADEAVFGYFLETFPVKQLRPGPILSDVGGCLNLKNPASYVWPGANHCQPGDHFRLDQREQAEAFVNYRGFPFAISVRQRVANMVTIVTAVAALALLAWCCATSETAEAVWRRWSDAREASDQS
ncbi:MAG: hypothetical protein KAI66_21865 [Lentisphaeria bacterium]|nr:hypothetical protein [Lentisphaeria bacterium]